MLFANSEVFGTFKGFAEKGLEFAAEIVAPYNSKMLDRPQLGQFLLIELGSPEEATLGRITRFVPTGLLAGPEGEDYVNTMQRRNQVVPEELKEQRLKYRVQIKLLGSVRIVDNSIRYIPSQRRLPHLGAKVALPSQSVLQALCRLGGGDTEIGDYVLGEYIFCGAQVEVQNSIFRHIDPKLPVTFDIHNLVSKRTVVFARAGYGKSNLIKYFVSELYRGTPKTSNNLDVGTLIFDADGEYFWPDRVRNRPGLCDVPHLHDKIVIFTNRTPPSPYYGSWKAGDIKLDIRDLPARDVVSIAVSAERQSQQNVLKLKALNSQNWRAIVDLIDAQGLQASDDDIGRLMGYPHAQISANSAEIAAARSNLNAIVNTLHDSNSRVLSGTIEALKRGTIVILDISLLSSSAGNMVAGLVLRRIFSHNQENFTSGMPIIPTIAVIEEAQSVLGKHLDETSPFVEWVKEGRKYELGAIMITQQPGSMASELLSQADNWFAFHLLSEGDASTLGRYNSHFSDDILAHLIGEPIQGNCFMWSAPHQPFVLPVRIRSFELLYQNNLNTSSTSEPAVATLATDIVHNINERLSKLADSFKERLLNPEARVKFLRIPKSLPDGSDGIGVGSGQLYYVIKDIKTASDTTPEDALKSLLFNIIFGEGAYSIFTFNGKEYYCLTESILKNGLGKLPEIKDA